MRAGYIAVAVGLMVCLAMAAPYAQSAPKGQTPSAPAMDPAQARDLMDRYCVSCHNERTKSGSLVLESSDVSRIGGDAPLWEKVVRKMRGRLMPPAGARRPDDATTAAFASWLETELDSFAAAHPNPGRPETLRRLNRTQYQNAIRDLLAVDVDVSGWVPADEAAHGFDNIGGVLRLSPVLMESYLNAAKRISRLAMGTPPPTVDEGQMYVVGRVQQHDRIEGLGLGTRGGMLVRHVFPQNGEYAFKMDMGDMDIPTEQHTLELTIDGAPVKTFPVNRVHTVRWSIIIGSPELVLEARVPVTAGPHDIGVAFHKRAQAIPEHWEEPNQTRGNAMGGGLAGPGGPLPILNAITIAGPYNAVGPGDSPSRHRILTCQPSPSASTSALRATADKSAGQDRASAEEATCAKSILSTLTRRAFRRPVTDADLKPMMAFYEEGRADGAGFEAGIESALRRLLASPEFLFRIEAEPVKSAERDGLAANVYRVSDIDLASRLSFFLWDSIPGDRLLDLAEQGRLRAPGVLAREVRRMLADPRSETLTTNFASQWLGLRKLETARPGGAYGQNFDGSLRDGLRRETELFVDSLVRENRPVVELLTANYTFLNERVARHYGIRNVSGSHFRRVTLPSDNPRRGLLGHGSILTVTSEPIRTSPVYRGKYILETILGTPPPPPPADVPFLAEQRGGARPKSMRERMAAHRANPVCAACHTMIDPLGFGLENFDAVGAWRDYDESWQAVDASGQLPDGSKFAGVNELRALLTRRPEQIATTVAERMLTYAVARGLEYYDMPALRKIVRDAARDDYRIHSTVTGIVSSLPFQMRSAPAAAAAGSASR